MSLPGKWASAERTMKTKNKKNTQDDPHCIWMIDIGRDSESWDTQCGNKFQFTTDGPVENGFEYCCYCGRMLKADAIDDFEPPTVDNEVV